VLENPIRDAIAQLMMKEWASGKSHGTTTQTNETEQQTWASLSTKNLNSK